MNPKQCSLLSCMTKKHIKLSHLRGAKQSNVGFLSRLKKKTEIITSLSKWLPVIIIIILHIRLVQWGLHCDSVIITITLQPKGEVLLNVMPDLLAFVSE